MKKLLLLGLAMVAAVAVAQSTTSFSVANTRALTNGCTDSGFTSTSGADLTNALGFNVVLSADRTDGGSQTLISTGTLDCCAYLPVSSGGSGTARTSRWMDCPSSLDLTVSSFCGTGARDCSSGDFEPLASEGRIAFVGNALLVDGGATVTTTISVRRRLQQ